MLYVCIYIYIYIYWHIYIYICIYITMYNMAAPMPPLQRADPLWPPHSGPSVAAPRWQPRRVFNLFFAGTIVSKVCHFSVGPKAHKTLNPKPRTLNPNFRSRGPSPGLGNGIFGSFGPIRIDLDQVSAQTVDSESKSWHLLRFHY